MLVVLLSVIRNGSLHLGLFQSAYMCFSALIDTQSQVHLHVSSPSQVWVLGQCGQTRGLLRTSACSFAVDNHTLTVYKIETERYQNAALASNSKG